jgi:hypothetical protein
MLVNGLFAAKLGVCLRVQAVVPVGTMCVYSAAVIMRLLKPVLRPATARTVKTHVSGAVLEREGWWKQYYFPTPDYST